MADNDTTSSYVELTSQYYSLCVGAYAAANQRALTYLREVWDIASRPYGSTAIETTVRENFDRANQIVALTVDQLQANGATGAQFAEQSVAHGAKVQDSVATALRGVVNTGVANLNYVKEAATQQFDEFSKRLDDVQTRVSVPVSHN
jgi:hypothetical protein